MGRWMPAIALWALMSIPPATVLGGEQSPPKTAKRPVDHTYHDVSVTDDYLWLENASDPEVKRWSDGENAGARRFLDGISSRPSILARIQELKQNIGAEYSELRYVNGRFFAMKKQPPKEQPFLVTLESLDSTDSEKVVADPNEIDRSGNTTIDFFVPSVDGSLVAVSMSKGGTEDGTVSVFEAATGKRLSDSIPRVNGGTAGGSVAWTPDGSGFYCTRYPHAGERPQAELPFYEQLYLHKLGTPASSDTYVLGRDFPRIAEIYLVSTQDGRHIIADVLNGDGGEHAFWLRGADGKWLQIADFKDECVKAKFGAGDDQAIYLLSYREAPNGKILRLPLDSPDPATAKVIVPASDVAISDFTPSETRLYVHDQLAGPCRIRIFGLKGEDIGLVALPSVCSVGEIVITRGGEVVLEHQTYTEPSGWYRLRPNSKTPEATALVMRSPADFSDIEVRREFAVSRDKTKVPINILLRKGTPIDGSAPLLLTGYGGFRISLGPDFAPERLLWLEQGGIIAIANLRGGGEFGEAWHKDGKLLRKQNVFDDFAACARHLVARGFASRDRLVAEGGSNGGLLMGAMITQHPDLFRVVVSHVGIYDMLRVELTPNGEFNTTEYGTVKDPHEFEALYHYSPYHQVKPGTAYPSVLFLTGANDPRVDPMHSRKMTARLQASTSSNRPILLRTSGSTGHGGGTPLSAESEEDADVYSFIFQELGIGYRTEAAARP